MSYLSHIQDQIFSAKNVPINFVAYKPYEFLLDFDGTKIPLDYLSGFGPVKLTKQT